MSRKEDMHSSTWNENDQSSRRRVKNKVSWDVCFTH